MVSKIITSYSTRDHYQKTHTINRDRNNSQIEVFQITLTTMLVEGRASSQASVVWVATSRTQALRSTRRQVQVALQFTRSIRMQVVRMPNLPWVQRWDSITVRVCQSGTRGRGCSVGVMEAYLRDSLDMGHQTAEEDPRKLRGIEELTTRVAISTRQALIRWRRTWESSTLVYQLRYWLVEVVQMLLYKVTITSKVAEMSAQNRKSAKHRTLLAIMSISKTGELWITSNKISSKTWYNQIKCVIRRKNQTSWATEVGNHWLSLTSNKGKGCMSWVEI